MLLILFIHYTCESQINQSKHPISKQVHKTMDSTVKTTDNTIELITEFFCLVLKAQTLKSLSHQLLNELDDLSSEEDRLEAERDTIRAEAHEETSENPEKSDALFERIRECEIKRNEYGRIYMTKTRKFTEMRPHVEAVDYEVSQFLRNHSDNPELKRVWNTIKETM